MCFEVLNHVVSVFSEKLVTMTWQIGWWRFSMNSLIDWPFTCMGENQVCSKGDLTGDTTKYRLSVNCKSHICKCFLDCFSISINFFFRT